MTRGLYFWIIAPFRAVNKTATVYGVLAQLVEQRTFNPFVVGSIPAHPTINKQRLIRDYKSFFMFAILEHVRKISYKNSNS